jgi:hypothetical protein
MNGLTQEFSIRMINQLQFWDGEAPWQPIANARREVLLVEYRDDHLTITELRGDGGTGSRIYAQRSVSMPNATTFVILPELPSRFRDNSFFPAMGTAVLVTPPGGAPRRLYAVGSDTNSGRCRGWLFDAVEA